MKSGYLRFEVRRALRDSRFLVFAVALPVGLFVLLSNLFQSQGAAPAYLMSGLAAFGAFKAALDTGARTAVERGAGWQRQLRLTPLSGLGYLVAKGAVAMLVALPPVVGVALVAALTADVRLADVAWTQAVFGIWLGTVPFALLGLLVGQLCSAQNMQTYQGGVLLLLSFVGGLLIPVSSFPPVLAAVAKALPSYWLAEIGHGAVFGNGRLGVALAVLAAYTVVLGGAVVVRYRRDGARA
ncbi:ABC transporter permease [Microtetraspora sp. NBRC 16547]|uniref:ABC transporter permease n=1 Tax=Microtetraspora sp. NBRC 16547 TaxID=3030993 RepID=UPI00249FF1F7|nr:ABC transporter permease [Microtetraspora sp. NBRC 16547]GLX00219.1 ABC transporter [Microtetraspora sp. NBRC 16547]